MSTINAIKESPVLDTPVALFEVTTHDGAMFRLSTHAVTLDGIAYQARVLRHNTFEFTLGADSITDGNARVSVTLANADGYFSGVNPTTGWKGALLTVRFGFFDVASGEPTSETRVLFRGSSGGIEELNESELRIGFQSRLAMQRAWLPSVRLQRRCPWVFPATFSQRQEAVSGGNEGSYSMFYRCGYSADVAGGVGKLDNGQAYTSCSFTRSDCSARGMLDQDTASNATRRFGGFELLPILDESGGLSKDSRTNAVAPLVYGTNWFDAPVVHARMDGKLVRAEAVVGVGAIQGILRVVVNGYELPLMEPGRDQTSTGFYRVVSLGERTGELNDDFGPQGSGPYGSFAYVSIGVPTTIASNESKVRVEVLAQGLILPRFDSNGLTLAPAFSANPAWVMMDILRRSGWRLSELDVISFARAAEYCDALIPASDHNGASIYVSRFRCNLALTSRRSAGEILRGIRIASRLYFAYGVDGKLQLRLEASLQTQHPAAPSGSNAVSTLNGGWPAYEFGDGTGGISGIARETNDASTLRIWSKPLSDSPNRVHVAYTDEFNEHQPDSLSVVEVNDAVRSGNEVHGTVQALGIPNLHQASRVANLYLLKATVGNLFVSFETSVRGIGLAPGDLITLSVAREGFSRKPFRVLSVGMALNCARIRVVAQAHEDEWYSDSSNGLLGGGSQRRNRGDAPRPLQGSVVGSDGSTQFEMSERIAIGADGGSSIILSAGYLAPPAISPAHTVRPMISPLATVTPTGGVLAGDRTLYYGVTAVDSAGNEGPMSALAWAQLGTGSTYQVEILVLSLPSEAVAMHLYRGDDAQRLLRVASGLSLGALVVDPGLAPQGHVPPDDRFDHANFYWRTEVAPPADAQLFGPDSIGNLGLGLGTNQNAGQVVRIVEGRGAGQERTIRGNTATTLTVAPGWHPVPDATSKFVIAESSWRFGSRTSASPAEFEVPNREGLTVHIRGTAASSTDIESSIDASPVTRWYLQGAPGEGGDSGLPPLPAFGLSTTGRGVVEVSGISFPQLENTRTIRTGTLTVHYGNELEQPAALAITSAISSEQEDLVTSAAYELAIGEVLQVGAELAVVREVVTSPSTYRVSRGAYGTVAQAHPSGSAILRLNTRSYVIAFPRDFFGSPASGQFSHAILLPSARVAAAEFFVTNDRGNSLARSNAYTMLSNGGLRSLSGGQYTLQVDGLLAIQSSASPLLTIEDSRSVRDIVARTAEAPTGVPVQLQIRKNGMTYANLSIAPNTTVSAVVNGAGLAPLIAGDVLSLEITSVGIGSTEFPGRDLTVTIRL